MVVEQDLPPLHTGPELHSMSTDHEELKETANPTITAAALPPPELSDGEAEAARPDSWDNLDEPVLTDG